MVSKKKLLIRVIAKHNTFDSWYDQDRDVCMLICTCGFEEEGPNTEIDNLHAAHVYSTIKKALKKRRQILSL